MPDLWLPFTQDIRQQGLSNASVTAVGSGASINANGKLGKCYYLDGTSNGYISTDFATNVGTNDFTISLWVKIPTISTGNYYAVISSKTAPAASAGIGIYWNYTQKKFLWSTADGTNATEIWMANAVDTIVYDKWIHLVMVRDNNDAKKGYFYINGTRYELASIPVIRNISSPTNLWIGRCSSGNYPLKMYISDIKFWNDHALSVKEIKELSKGLIAHYTLDNQYNSSNLIINGFGELGSEGWTSNTSVATTDLPTADTTIKRTFTNGQSADFIQVNPDNQYTISCYMKTTGGTSGNTYPSFLSYDIDKKFIQNYHCRSGFGVSYNATLTQPLNRGDTVIHASNLSAWTTATNYYYYVAIFGYKDSFGHVYPDYEYSQDVLAFGSYSDKSHLDKTNNTITLNSPYNGEPRPIGTAICQATAGATYFYPFGGVAISSIQDWTFKTATFTFYSQYRLRYAKYIKWFNYGGAKYGGIKLTDNTWSTDTVYDTSGNLYNGTVHGDLTISPDTARYSLSTAFTDGRTDYISAPIHIGDNKNITINLWMKSIDGSGGYSNYHIPLSISGNNFEFSMYNSGRFRNGFIISGTRYVGDYGTINCLDKNWHMLTATYDGSNIKRYVDSELVNTTSVSGTLSTGDRLLILGNLNSSTYGNKNILESDMRIYATALSADDIKELYEVGASIDKDGNTFAYEYIEN